jgi:hypothetical protein
MEEREFLHLLFLVCPQQMPVGLFNHLGERVEAGEGKRIENKKGSNLFVRATFCG